MINFYTPGILAGLTSYMALLKSMKDVMYMYFCDVQLNSLYSSHVGCQTSGHRPETTTATTSNTDSMNQHEHGDDSMIGNYKYDYSCCFT